MPAPIITGVTPNEGPLAGGTAVVITGSNFNTPTVTYVAFYDGASSFIAASFTVDSDTQISCVSPAVIDPASCALLVVNSFGNAVSDSSDPGGVFVFSDSSTDPRVQFISPASGDAAGGTAVTITGTRFTAATAVTFDGIAAASFTVDNDSQISAVTPAHSAVGVFVAVTAGGETNPLGLPAVFTFTTSPGPTITSITPPYGIVTGGDSIVVTGTDFSGVTSVYVDADLVSYTVDSDTQITLTTLPHAVGSVSIVISNDFGAASDLFDFTIDGGPPSTLLLSECLRLAIGAFVADTVTPDGDGTCYTVEAIDGWFDSPPVRVGTMEADVLGPRGEAVVAAETLGRPINVVVIAHTLDRQTPLGNAFCFAAIESIKAAFRLLFVPDTMTVDDVVTRTALVRRVGPIKAEILGAGVAVRCVVPMFAEQPTLVVV